MPEGRVIKAYSGHYFVSHKDDVVDCKIRGRLQKEGKMFSLEILSHLLSLTLKVCWSC